MKNAINSLRSLLNLALRGKPAVIERVLAALLAKGHVLLEDMPGLGKTTLAKALANGIHARFARLQCTPDLLPGDITGFSLFNQQTRAFEFQPGPVFADILLVDEINRATPRTQSALLEAMAEGQVTTDGNVRHLSDTFFVIATQNPVEHHGTYPLPEAQLDRFAMKLSIGYPERGDELTMLRQATMTGTPGYERGAEWAFTLEELRTLQQQVARIAVTPPVQEYLLDLVRATRQHPQVTVGVSPRGALTWQRVAQAHAFLSGREFVTPDDIQEVATPVLSVRLVGDFQTIDSLWMDLMERTRVPVLPSPREKSATVR
ncbi:MAG: MoxR family ATPase [Capsulimonadales bacterium]|nr:MoxR family ATPase [Capsulimonadales bacterium]